MRTGVSQALCHLVSYLPHETRVAGLYVTPLQCGKQDALFFCYKQSPDNARSVAFSQRSNNPRLIEDETLNDRDIINNLTD
ncbi:hypothetical protein TNCV_889841 [Trichonephila clavipes]|nr:hypothetical protein TNCV_889841 [Trichonephila clavipes]